MQKISRLIIAIQNVHLSSLLLIASLLFIVADGNLSTLSLSTSISNQTHSTIDYLNATNFASLFKNETENNYNFNGSNSNESAISVITRIGVVVNNNSSASSNSTSDVSKSVVEPNYLIDLTSSVVGWLYFLAWSFSFYPQIWVNYQRKSVVGLNFDFLAFNFVGDFTVLFFNTCLYWVPYIQNQYYQLYPDSQIPVEINDVVFAYHATIALIVTIYQCFIYERGKQRLSSGASFLIVASTVASGILVILCLAGTITWLTLLYYFSYVKLATTFLKDWPQIWYNYQRKSTVGWSIGYVLLDFVGGWFSMLQMILIAYNYADWATLFGNFSKFGLGVFTMALNCIFLAQHYCLYGDVDPQEMTPLVDKHDRWSKMIEKYDKSGKYHFENGYRENLNLMLDINNANNHDSKREDAVESSFRESSVRFINSLMTSQKRLRFESVNIY